MPVEGKVIAYQHRGLPWAREMGKRYPPVPNKGNVYHHPGTGEGVCGASVDGGSAPTCTRPPHTGHLHIEHAYGLVGHHGLESGDAYTIWFGEGDGDE